MERSIEFCESLQGQKRQLLETLSAYEKRIAEYTKGLRDLYMDKVKGLLNDSDFSALSKDFPPRSPGWSASCWTVSVSLRNWKTGLPLETTERP